MTRGTGLPKPCNITHLQLRGRRLPVTRPVKSSLWPFRMARLVIWVAGRGSPKSKRSRRWIFAGTVVRRGRRAAPFKLNNSSSRGKGRNDGPRNRLSNSTQNTNHSYKINAIQLNQAHRHLKNTKYTLLSVRPYLFHTIQSASLQETLF